MRTDYDVIVLGGGIAGIAAALSSAREGASTLLIEKECALGGLATLGLVVAYLPLCDGRGTQLSTGVAEELMLLPTRSGPGKPPECWTRPASEAERSKSRYSLWYEAAPMMLECEKLLLDAGARILYDLRLSAACSEGGAIRSVSVETKKGRVLFTAKAYVDATGDADLCYFSGEPTVQDDDNRAATWYFSYDGKQRPKVHMLTDPLTGPIPEGSRAYSGIDPEDISQHLIDGRRRIREHVEKLREADPDAYAIEIPAVASFRMTRRLDAFPFSENLHDGVWFSDAIGMIGNWKHIGPRYSLPYRCITGVRNANLFAAGRACSAEKSGWDLTRVIPSCAVTGQAAGVAAALFAAGGERPGASAVQERLTSAGVRLRPELFSKAESEL